MEFVIKKLGWENAAQIHKSAKNIYNDFVAWKKQAIVVSAMRSSEFNTTDNLIKIWQKLEQENVDKNEVFEIIEDIKNFHLNLLEDEMLCSKEELISLVENIFLEFKVNIQNFIKQKNKKLIPSKSNDYSIELENGEKLSIIGFWEKVSAKIMSKVVDSMSLNWVCSKSVDLWNIVWKKDLDNKSKKEVFDLLSNKLSSIILEKTNCGNIVILSGYIWSFPEWIEQRVGRWYSDATAAISAVWLARKNYDVVIEIQKSVKWLLSADPRILDNPNKAKLLKKVDYLIAREITWDAGAQAKLLHPQTLRPEVQEAGIKIHLFNPFSEEDGSWIVSEDNIEMEKWINFIWWRKDVVFFSVSSGKMFEKSTFSDIFSIVKKYFLVDIVSTSETEVSFTIDSKNVNDTLLDKLKIELEEKLDIKHSKFEFVEYKKNKALIFCVWKYMKDYIWLMAQVVSTLSKANINIEIASQWMLQRSMIFWIDEKDLKNAVNLLHKKFIHEKV